MEYKQKSLEVFLKRSYQRIFLHYGHTSRYIQYSGQTASDKIRDLLQSPDPAMICRFGSNELQCVVGYMRESKFLSQFERYRVFYWRDNLDNICEKAGFFPKDQNLLYDFCRLMIEDMRLIDILGSWRKEEYYVNEATRQAIRIRLRDIEPYVNEQPWTVALAGKKVLVIHPFEDTIRSQYERREHIFQNKDVLPDFELQTIKAVQSIAGNQTGFATWFDALDHMKRQIESFDFDIALIGCGAYGFPLAAHVKRVGKKAVHVGGALQLMFGIMGKRWESNPIVRGLKNSYWVYPSATEGPKNKELVEGGCYW